MGVGRITEKVKGFKAGVELLRTTRYGDVWQLRVRISGSDYRLRNLGTTDLSEAQEKAFTTWQSVLKEVEEDSATKLSITRLFWLFVDAEQQQVEMGKLSQQTVTSKKSGVVNGILPYIAHKRLRSPKRINSNRDFRDFPDFRLGMGKDPATVNNEIITIREALQVDEEGGIHRLRPSIPGDLSD